MASSQPRFYPGTRRITGAPEVKFGSRRTDTAGMGLQLACVYLVFAATLVRPLAARLRLAQAMCARCGRAFERRALGEPVCHCDR